MLSPFLPGAARAARPLACSPVRLSARLSVPLAALALATGATLSARPAAAQGVGIDPHVVVLQDRTRSGTVSLLNTGETPLEVSVALAYGYAGSDSTGLSTILFPNPATLTGQEPNAAPWITVYPRRVTIPPHGEQVVRFQARPPADLADGEAWARVLVTARHGVGAPGAGSATAEGATDSIRVGFTFETRTVFPLFYRKGTLTTGATVDSLVAQVAPGGGKGDTLTVRAAVARTGNAAYLGTARVVVRNAAGAVVATTVGPHAVYQTRRARWTLPLPAGLPAGAYRATLLLTTDREDLPARAIVGAAPVERTVAFEVPARRIIAPTTGTTTGGSR